MITLKTSKLYNCYIHLFEVEIYGAKILFISHKSYKGYLKAISYLNSIGFDTDDFNSEDWSKCYGFVDKKCTNKELGTVHLIMLNTHKYYLSKYKDTLAHEGMHLVQNICEHHGLEHRRGSHNEHIAYLTGYIMDYLCSL